MKKRNAIILCSIVILAVTTIVWWSNSLKITLSEGNFLPGNHMGFLFLIEDNNPFLDFELTYSKKGDEDKVVDVARKGHTVIIFDDFNNYIWVFSNSNLIDQCYLDRDMLYAEYSGMTADGKSDADFNILSIMLKPHLLHKRTFDGTTNNTTNRLVEHSLSIKIK